MIQFVKKILQDPTARQFVRFVFVGMVNTLFGFTVYALLIWIGLPPQPALAISFVCGVIWNFFTHARFVFYNQNKLSRLPYYVLSYVIVYLFNAFSLQALLNAGLPPIVAQALLTPCAAILSFTLISKALTGRFPLIGK